MYNPLKADPTRTTGLRRLFSAEVTRRFASLRRKVVALVVDEDVFGLSNKPLQLVVNQRWKFNTTSEKLTQFSLWLADKIDGEIFDDKTSEAIDTYWTEYARRGYEKGQARAFDQVNKGGKIGNLSFYEGAKHEFLRSAFSNPVSVDRVKVLALRSLTDLKGISEKVATLLLRELTDGLVRGKSPREIAQGIVKVIDTVGIVSANRIARTEIIRAHAEGQLDTFERLGLDKVGVAVEWSTAGDGRVCELCQPLQGVVMSLAEARGAIPRHANCRCSFVPANVGEKFRTKIIGGISIQIRQKKTQTEIQRAIDKSVRAEIPKKSKKSVAEQKEVSRWNTASKTIAKNRPKNVFIGAKNGKGSRL